MKKYIVIALLFALLPLGSLMGQCSGGTNAGAVTPTLVFQTVGMTTGQYRTFAATAGETYIFSLCQGGGSAGFDSQLTILNNAGAFAGGYSDDVCGVASEVTWLCATTGTYRVLLNDYYCLGSGIAATLAYRRFVPGPGATCGNPHVIPSLPFTANGLTTCGAGNDYASPQSCASPYMGGEDYVFRYVASGPQTIRITLTGTLTYTGIFVTQGCPDVGICIPASAGTGCVTGFGLPNESSSGNPVAEFVLPGPGTYFFFVDTYPSPTCTGFNINVQTVTGGGGGPGCGTYTISTPAYNPDNFNTGTQLTFPDDEFSAAIPLPFTFCFMGTNYTQIVVSSNAYVSFNPACAGQTSGWDTDVIPSPANTNSPEARNSFMFPWADVDPSVGGTIRYNTYGTAPNRRFVVSFRNIPMFSLTCNSQLYTGQAVFYETSFVMDMYIQNYPNCPSWNNGEGVLGLFDASGTVAVPVPGFNNTVFSLSNFARRFTPNCPSCLILPVSFSHLSGEYLADHNLVSWSTGHEVHSASLTLERSRDGKNFETVGTVDGAGDEPMGRSYQMQDLQRFSPQTFYRVVQRDLDGAETISEVIMVSSNPDGVNIANLQINEEVLSIDLQNGGKAQKIQLEVTDAVGKLVVATEVQVENGSSRHDLDIAMLSAGVYLAQVKASNGAKQVRKFVKN